MTNYREQIAAVSDILMGRFPNLLAKQLVNMSFDIVDAVMKNHDCRESAPEDPSHRMGQ